MDPPRQGGRAADGRCGSRIRKLRAYILKCKHKPEKVSWKPLNPQSLTLVDAIVCSKAELLCKLSI